MNPTDRKIVASMRYSNGTNWTPLSVSERMDASREYVKSRMHTLAEQGRLERVSRGLYRLPES